MIDYMPFQRIVKSNGNGRIVSYGTSSYGYDVRCADEFYSLILNKFAESRKLEFIT